MLILGDFMRFFLPLILCFLLLFTSCSIINSSKDLNGFSERMNTFYSSGEFSTDGYICNTEKSYFSRYFTFREETLFLKLYYDEKYNLTVLTLAGKGSALKRADVCTFIENAVRAFLYDEESENEVDMEKILKELESTSQSTNRTELSSAEIITDSSKLGWVLTVQLL